MSVYSDTLKLNEHWSEYLLKTDSNVYNWCEGAYRSRLRKSVMNTLAFALQLEKTPDQIHLVIASTVASAKAVIEDGDGLLGLSQYFASRYRKGKYKGLDAGFIKTPSGLKIILYLGGSMESSYKAFRGISAGCIILEEANLLHENTINEAKGRNLMAKNRKFFISHNPTNSKHSIYKWLKELQDKGLVNYDHSTIYQNAAMSEERRNQIVSEFDPSSVFYRQYILGERVDAEGVIFNVRENNILNDIGINEYQYWIAVADPGISKSASVFTILGYNYKKRCVDVLKEYSWKNNLLNGVAEKHASELADDFIFFINDFAHKINSFPSCVIVDGFPGDLFFDTLTIKSRNCYPVKMPIDGKEKDDVRIRRISSWLFNEKLRVYDKCLGCINDLKTLEYDQDYMSKHSDIKIKQYFDENGHNDYWDCIVYGTSYFERTGIMI